MMIHCGALEVLPNPFVFDALEALKRDGAIRSIGASVYGAQAALTAIEHGGYDCLQIAHNVLDRRPEFKVVARAQQADVGLIARSVLLKGALTSISKSAGRVIRFEVSDRAGKGTGRARGNVSPGISVSILCHAAAATYGAGGHMRHRGVGRSD